MKKNTKFIIGLVVVLVVSCLFGLFLINRTDTTETFLFRKQTTKPSTNSSKPSSSSSYSGPSHTTSAFAGAAVGYTLASNNSNQSNNNRPSGGGGSGGGGSGGGGSQCTFIPNDPSCRNCRWEGDNYRCECREKKDWLGRTGKFRDTSIKARACRWPCNIRNNDGRLVCS